MRRSLQRPARLAALAVATLLAAPVAWPQTAPRVGYVFPAGGQQGTTFEVTLGGQFLDGATNVILSGGGAQVTVLRHTRPLTPKQLATLREQLKELQDRERAAGRRLERDDPALSQILTNLSRQLGIPDLDLKRLAEYRKNLADPKRQPNPQLAETVVARLTLAPDAAPGPRELRLQGGAGLSNPLRFQVSDLPEELEAEPNDRSTGTAQDLPLVVNGQILPGDVDRFRFNARAGQSLVAIAQARELIPYLADAVPGWFQATLTLSDDAGRELAYADDYRFHPDPVLHCVIPADGAYVLEIKDAIYRGREDFVYRIATGELPFVTDIFPLGGRAGTATTVEVQGWNLPADRLALGPKLAPGIQPISVAHRGHRSNRVPFAVDPLPDRTETEPNDEPGRAQRLEPNIMVNGRIDRPGDQDVFEFVGRSGAVIVAEVLARRLGSPLDSVLRLSDAGGRELAANDDQDDKGSGLLTHHADARLHVTLPADGRYRLALGDAQHRGGAAYAYRLRLSQPRPDFALRVVPSTLNARPGAVVPVTVYALRQDGFDGEITLALDGPPPGYALSGAWVPAGQDQVRLTLTVPTAPGTDPLALDITGRAVIGGREVCQAAVPADDLMQAFSYRHLVPASQLLVAVGGSGRPAIPLQVVGDAPVQIPSGGTAQVQVRAPLGPRLGRMHLEPSDPPAGIGVRTVSATRGGLTIELEADAAKAKPGLQGNLILQAYSERPPAASTNAPAAGRRRVPIATLPAIPFEVVAAR